MPSLLDLVETNYRLRLRAIRTNTITRLRDTYGRIGAAEFGDRRIVSVTPAQAEAWLGDRHGAAPIDRAKVARLAQAAERGQLRDAPGDPIQVSPDGVLLNGRHRLAAIVAAGLTVDLTVAFGVPEHAISTTFEAVAPVAARLVTASQDSAQTLTRAYVNRAASITSGRPADPVATPKLGGTTAGGVPVAESLLGIRPMVLSAIADGRPLAEALGFGAYLVTRFADNEISRAVDSEIEAQGRGRAVGWRGITHSPSDDCIGNAGVHPFSRQMYRHGGCRCERQVVFA